MPDLRQALREFVSTSNSGKYTTEEELMSKFPELQGYDIQVLREFVSTSNSGKYSDEETLFSKFPEFGISTQQPMVQEQQPVKKKEGSTLPSGILTSASSWINDIQQPTEQKAYIRPETTVEGDDTWKRRKPAFMPDYSKPFETEQPEKNYPERPAELGFIGRYIPERDKDKVPQFVNKTLDALTPETFSSFGTEPSKKALEYYLKDMGFKVEDSDKSSSYTGKYVNVISPNGRKHLFYLGNEIIRKETYGYAGLPSEDDINELKDFVRSSVLSDSSIAKKEYLYEKENKKFRTKEEIENEVKDINAQAQGFQDDYKKMLTLQKDIDDIQKDLKRWEDFGEQNTPKYIQTQAYLTERQKELEEYKGTLKSKEATLSTQNQLLEKAMGKYFEFQSTQGTFESTLYRSIAESSANIFSNYLRTATSKTIDSLPISNLMDEKTYNELYQQKAKARGIDINEPMDAIEFAKIDKEINSEIRDEIKKAAITGKAGGEKLENVLTVQGVRESLKEFLPNAVFGTSEYKEKIEKEGNFVERGVVGLAGSLPAMVGGKYIRLANMFMMTTDAVLQEMDNDPDFANVSENEKELIAMPIGVIGAALEEVGLRSLLKGTSITTNIVKSVLGRVPPNASAAVLRKATFDAVKEMGLRGTVALAGSTLVEAETGAAQQVNEYFVKDTYNMLKGKKMFDNPEFLSSQYIYDIYDAARTEAVGGFVMGVPNSIASAFKKDGFQGLDDTTFKIFEELAKDNTSRKFFVTDLKNKINSGQITAQQGKDIIDAYDQASGMIGRVPDEITDTNARKIAMDLISEKKRLEGKREKYDDALAKPIQDKVDKINEQLTQLTQDAIQKQAAGEVSLQPETEPGKEMEAGGAEAGSQATPQQGVLSPEEKEKLTQNRRVDLFPEESEFAEKIGGSGRNSTLSDYSETNGIGVATYTNPDNGLVDVIMSGTSDNDYVGYVRVYENGKPTNRWTSKMSNESGNKDNFKTMISQAQAILPEGHEYTETTNISVDGVRVYSNQLNRGYEVLTDANGNPVTNTVTLNSASVEGLQQATNQDEKESLYDNMVVRTKEEFDKIKEKINSLMPDVRVLWNQANNTVQIQLPVLVSRTKTTPEGLGTQAETATKEQETFEQKKSEIEKIVDPEQRKVAEIEFIMSNLMSGVGEAAANKIREYADRIISGKETRDQVIQGLPKSFVNGIDQLLAAQQSSTTEQQAAPVQPAEQQFTEQDRARKQELTDALAKADKRRKNITVGETVMPKADVKAELDALNKKELSSQQPAPVTEVAPPQAKEQIKVFRGIGNNVLPSENNSMLWVAEDKEVAKNYAGMNEKGELNVEDLTIDKPTNPIELPYKLATDVRGKNIGENLRKLATELYKQGKISRDKISDILDKIKQFEISAGDNLELFTTKINKSEASELFSEIAQNLGFDAMSLPESAVKGGEKTNTYGVFKNKYPSFVETVPVTEVSPTTETAPAETFFKSVQVSPQIKEKKQIIDIEKVKEKLSNAYEFLKKYKGHENFTPQDVRNALAIAYNQMMRFKSGAENLLSQIKELEELVSETPPKRTVTKEEFKKQLRDSGDFTKKQLAIFDALVDSLNTDTMPEYNSNEKSLEFVGINAKNSPNFYSFVDNILSAKSPESFIHEIGHFAFYNILSKEDRISFLEGMIDTFYGQGKPPMKSKVAMTSEKVTITKDGKTFEFSTNVGDNFSEYFAEQFRQWYLKEKTTPKQFDTIFEKVEKFLEKLINKLRTGEYIDKNLIKYFEKIINNKSQQPVAAPVTETAPVETLTPEQEADKLEQMMLAKMGAPKVEAAPTTEGKVETENEKTAKRIRGKKMKGTLSTLDFGITQTVYNGALEFMARQVEKGTKLGNAIANTMKWIDEKMEGKKWDKGAFGKYMNDTYKITLGDGRQVDVLRDDSKETAEVINGWYSEIEQRMLDAKEESLPANKWADKLRSKEDEDLWTGVRDFLQSKGNETVSKKEIKDFIKNNRVEIVEVVKRQDDTKFSQYQLEGDKENYKEVLVTLPSKSNLDIISNEIYQKQYTQLTPEERVAVKRKARERGEAVDESNLFKSSHFDEPNILVHLRMNTRTDADGNKVLFLEEVQSDWGQKGKKEGFEDLKSQRLSNEKQGLLNEYNDLDELTGVNRTSDVVKKMNDILNKIKDINKKLGLEETDYRTVPMFGAGVSQAPFVMDTNAWVKLGLKVALREAVAQNATKIAWTNGEQQIKRYSLEKVADEVRYSKNPDGTYRVIAYKKGENVSENRRLQEDKLEDTLGKDIAQRIIDGVGEEIEGVKSLTGENLSVGGTGMKGFYGSQKEGSLGIVGNVAKSLFKQDPKIVQITTRENLSSADKIYEAYDRNGNVIKRGNSESYIKSIAEQNNGTYKLVEARQQSTQNSIDVTPELKQSVQKGLPLFSNINLSDAVRSLKIKGPGGLQSNILGVPIAIWNAAMDTVAKAIDAGVALSGAVQKGYDYIKDKHKAINKERFENKVLIGMYSNAIQMAREGNISDAGIKTYLIRKGLTESQADALLAIKPKAEKKPISKEKIVGKPKPKKVTVNEMTALKDQIRLEARAAREAKGDMNKKRKMLIAAINEMKKKGSISVRQAKALINRVNSVNLDNPVMVERLLTYADKVFNDAEYADKLNKANDLQSDIKKLSKNKDKLGNLTPFAAEFAKIDPAMVENIDEYIEMASNVKEGVQGSKIVRGNVVPADMVDVGKTMEYVNKMMEAQDKLVRQKAIESLQNLMDVDVSDLTYEKIVELIDLVRQEENASEDQKEEIAKKIEEFFKLNKDREKAVRDAINKMFDSYAAVIKNMFETGIDPFSDPDNPTTVEFKESDKKIVEEFMAMDLKQLDAKEALRAADALNNFIVNKSIAGMEGVLGTYRGRKNVKEVNNKGVKSREIKMYFSPAIGRLFFEQFASVPLYFERLFKGFKAGQYVREKMGINSLINHKAEALDAANRVINKYVLQFSKMKPNKKSFQDMYNIIERGIIGDLAKTIVGDEKQVEAEFNRRKKLIEESIDVLNKGGTKKETKAAKIIKEVYDKIARDANNIAEVKAKADQINVDAVQFWVDEWAKLYDQFADVALSVYNKVLDKNVNYVPDRFGFLERDDKVKKDTDSTESLFFSNSNTENFYKKEAGSLMKSTPPTTLLSGKANMYVNLSFDTNNANALLEALIDIKTAADIRQIQAFKNSPEFENIIPSGKDASLTKDRIATLIRNIRNKRIVTDKVFRDVTRKLDRIAALGTALALAGPTQAISQTVPVAVNTLVNSGGNLNLSVLNNKAANDFMNNSGMGIANRGADAATELETLNQKLEAAATSKTEKAARTIENINRLYLKVFLSNFDVMIARASWMTYYEKSLRKQGINTKNIDYNTHKQNKEAAQYAQDMVDRQQNISDKDLAGKMYQSDNPLKQFITKIAMPLTTFRMNQTTRFSNDLAVLSSKTASNEDKAIARMSLGGFAAEMATFRLVKLYIGYYVFYNLAQFIRGEEDDEEEKKKKWNNMLKGAATSATTDVFSPAPFADVLTRFGFSTILDQIQEFIGTEKEERYNIFTDQGKTVFESFISDLGILGIALDKATKLHENIKLGVTGKFTDKYGNEKTIMEKDRELLSNPLYIALGITTTLGLNPFSPETNNVMNTIVKSAKKDAMTTKQLETYEETGRDKSEAKEYSAERKAMKEEAYGNYKTLEEFEKNEPEKYDEYSAPGGKLYKYRESERKEEEEKNKDKPFRGLSEERFKELYPTEWKRDYGPGTRYFRAQRTPEALRKKAEEKRAEAKREIKKKQAEAKRKRKEALAKRR